MLVVTTENPPPGYRIADVFSMIELTYPIEISRKPVFRGFFERNRNEHDEALGLLVKAGQEATSGEANALIGVRVSTAAAAFSNGSFLYLTYLATPVKLEQQPS